MPKALRLNELTIFFRPRRFRSFEDSSLRVSMSSQPLSQFKTTIHRCAEKRVYVKIVAYIAENWLIVLLKPTRIQL